MNNSIKLFVNLIDPSSTFEVEINQDDLILKLAQEISARANYSVENMRILYHGVQLNNDMLVRNTDLHDLDSVYVVPNHRQDTQLQVKIVANFTSQTPEIHQLPQNEEERLRQIEKVRRPVTRAYRRASNTLQEICSLTDLNDPSLPYKIHGLGEVANRLSSELQDIFGYSFLTDNGQLSASYDVSQSNQTPLSKEFLVSLLQEKLSLVQSNFIQTTLECHFLDENQQEEGSNLQNSGDAQQSTESTSQNHE